MTAWLHRQIRARIDPRPLAATRITLAVAALLESAQLAILLPALAAPAAVRLPHPWSPLPAFGPALAWSVAAITAGAALALALGWRARAAATALAGTLAVVLAADRQLYSNHLWLLVCLIALLALTDCGAARSLDARRRGGAPEPVRAWPARLLQTQLTAVYTFAALTKLNPEYLSGAVLAAFLRATSPPAAVLGRQAGGPLAALAVATVAIEALLAIALWIPRLRRPAFALGIGFHLAILSSMEPALPFAVFGVASIAVYPLFSARSLPAGAPPG